MHAPVELSKLVRRDLAALAKQDAPSVRMVRRRHARALERESPEVVLEFVRLLLRDAGWGERVVAWETQEDRLAPRVRREVLNKLTTNRKNPPRMKRR